VKGTRTGGIGPALAVACRVIRFGHPPDVLSLLLQATRTTRFANPSQESGTGTPTVTAID